MLLGFDFGVQSLHLLLLVWLCIFEVKHDMILFCQLVLTICFSWRINDLSGQLLDRHFLNFLFFDFSNSGHILFWYGLVVKWLS